MASSCEYPEYVLDLLGGADGIECRKMMVELEGTLNKENSEDLYED